MNKKLLIFISRHKFFFLVYFVLSSACDLCVGNLFVVLTFKITMKKWNFDSHLYWIHAIMRYVLKWED